jgi:hypothetical protein
MGGTGSQTQMYQCRYDTITGNSFLFPDDMNVSGLAFCTDGGTTDAGVTDAGEDSGTLDPYGPASSLECDPDEVYETNLSAAPANGLWLFYQAPVYNMTLHAGLYDWTDYGANGPGGWNGWIDTEWQLRCVTQAGAVAMYCPMEDAPLYQREYMPKLNTSATADQSTTPPGCEIYHDHESLYLCNSVTNEADVGQLYCPGIWQIHQDGVVQDEYVDAPGAMPEASSLFKKIVRAPGDPSAAFTTYRVHIGVLWTP